MNKIYNKFFDETYYTKTLKNGLKVIIFHKPDYLSTTACFGTRYGALDINQEVNGKKYHFNPGTAHFLEHKLFEAEGKDILNKFSELGANVNAFTSYKETVYYFSKTSDNIDDCLNLLLDFVQDLDISDASVEKEKGIICEELAMYKQNPDQELINETYKSLYKYYPLNNDIGGTSETVNKITKKELELCYKLNYHPSNMILVVVSPIDPKHLMKVIVDNQNKKVFKHQDKIININKKEPLIVTRVKHTFNMDVNAEKTCYAIKLEHNFKDNLEAHEAESALQIYLNTYFSKINPDYQKWLDQGIINDYFDFEVDFDKEYAYILFYNETEKIEEFKEFIDNTLKNNIFNEEIVNQLKHRMIGNSFKLFNDIEGFAIGYIRRLLEDVDYFKDINKLMNINYKKVLKIVKNYKFDNYALIHINKSGK